MKLRPRRTIPRAIAATVVCLLGSALASGQAGPEPTTLTAEKVFKNVKVLTGLPVNEFMATMGFFSAALGYSCENCHGEDSGLEHYADENSQKKQTARRMIVMMSAINKAYFGGRQVLTCYSCHRGGHQPKVTPN